MESWTSLQTRYLGGADRPRLQSAAHSRTRAAADGRRIRARRDGLVAHGRGDSDRQIQDHLGALEVVLSDEHMRRLDAVTAVALGYPHDLNNSAEQRAIMTGGRFDQIDYPVRIVRRQVGTSFRFD
jgi:hypothetical protein